MTGKDFTKVIYWKFGTANAVRGFLLKEGVNAL